MIREQIMFGYTPAKLFKHLSANVAKLDLVETAELF